MGIGTSLVLIAIGAILRWAVNTSVSGVNLHTIGLIVFLVGVVGLAVSLLWMTLWAPRRDGRADVPPPPY
jgi:hypothetical protein